MNLFDAFVIDGVRRTADGYLAAHAKVARTGIQIYKGSELGRPELDKVRVYRPPEEVFHADALKSFTHRPVTLKHPNVPVTARNWKKFAGGQTGDEVVRDGEYVRVPMVMMDQALIDAYEKRGIKELSMGYSTDIQWRTGVTDAGESYDAVQTAIRGNHLAIVPAARGGDQLRIGDDKDEHGYGSYKRGEGPNSKGGDDSEYTPEEEAQIAEMHAGITARRIETAKAYNERIYKEEAERKKRRASQRDSAIVSDGTKACPDCGAEVSDDAQYCPKCGYDFNDDEDDDNLNDGVYPMKLTLDGLTVNVADDQSAAIIDKHIATLTKKLRDSVADLEEYNKKKKKNDDDVADAKKAVDAKDGEIAVLKQQLKDAQVTPERLDVMVKDRVSVIDAAKPLVGDKYVFDGKTLDAIRKDAVAVKLGDAVTTMPVDAITGAFMALTKDAKPANAAAQIGDAIAHRPHTVTYATDAREAAYDAMVKRTANAWKTPVAQ